MQGRSRDLSFCGRSRSVFPLINDRAYVLGNHTVCDLDPIKRWLLSDARLDTVGCEMVQEFYSSAFLDVNGDRILRRIWIDGYECRRITHKRVNVHVHCSH